MAKKPSQSNVNSHATERSEIPDQNERWGFNRRNYLRLLGGSAIATVGSAAAVGPAAAASQDDNSEASFPSGAAVRGATIDSLEVKGWEVVDVVEQGVDNSGETPVEEDVTALIEDETVLVFPDGEYLFQGTVVDQEVDHFAIIGEPDATPQFVVGEEFRANERDFPNYSVLVFGFNGGGSGIVFRNFEINMEGEGIGAGGIQLSIKGDGGYLKDIDFAGENDSRRANIAVEIPDEDAILGLHDVRMPDGASREFDAPSAADSVGINATRQTTGELHLGNCVVGGFPNNGVYASKVGLNDNPGKVIVRGGRFFNSDRDQLRVGANSEIYNAYCYSDTIKPGFNNLRGIWIRHADGVLIKNTTIEQMTADPGSGIRIDGTSGKTTIQNTRILLDSPGFGIWGLTPRPPTGGDFNRPPGSEVDIDCKNVSITGSAAGQEAVRIEDRDGSWFKNACIDLSGENRNGFVFRDSDATVYNARIVVPGEQIVARNSDLETHNIRDHGNCPPTRGHGR